MNSIAFFRTHLRFFLFCGVCVLATSLILIQTFRAEAEVAIFNPQAIEERTELRTDLIEQTTLELHEHTWSAFSGSVPLGSVVEDVSLVFSWSLEVNQATDTIDTTIKDVSSVVSEKSEEHSSDVVREDDETSIPGDIVSESSESVSGDASTADVIVLPEVEIEEPLSEAETTVDSDSQEIVVPDVPEEVEPVAAEESEASAVDPAESPVGFIQIHKTDTYPWVEGNIITPIESGADTVSATAISESTEERVEAIPVVMADTTTEADVITEVDADEILSVDIEADSELVTEETILISDTGASHTLPAAVIGAVSEAPVLYPTLESAEIQYSLDGDAWTTLGAVNLLTSQELSIDFNGVALESIPSLRIRVVYFAPLDAPVIEFQHPQLEFSYMPGVVEEVIPGPSDMEPNFSVSSVKVDIEQDGVRAVLLERGGIVELWSEVHSENVDATRWSRLSGGSTIDGDAPLAVYGRTIFWIDQRAQTLFAYDVDRGSLMGSPLAFVDGVGSASLLFGSVKKPWVVEYSLVTNTFEFNRISDVAP